MLGSLSRLRSEVVQQSLASVIAQHRRPVASHVDRYVGQVTGRHQDVELAGEIRRRHRLHVPVDVELLPQFAEDDVVLQRRGVTAVVEDHVADLCRLGTSRVFLTAAKTLPILATVSTATSAARAMVKVITSPPQVVRRAYAQRNVWGCALSALSLDCANHHPLGEIALGKRINHDHGKHDHHHERSLHAQWQRQCFGAFAQHLLDIGGLRQRPPQ